jgi:DNA-binding IclR family transcriptional regulator
MEPPSAPDLPPELRAFIYSCIDSVDQLEVLMYVRTVLKAVTARELASACALTPAAARHHAETLTARGLLRAEVHDEVRYQFAPTTPDLRRYADLLAQACRDRRQAVLRSVSVRSARTFADAFRFRRDE